MPPKVKTTKQDIINKAIEMVRRDGIDSINARDLAASLGCSTQPIFSNFESMEDLHAQICSAAEKIYVEFTKKEIESGCYTAYKASGMAYIKFAKEEKQLFKFLFMRDRSGENISDDSEFMDEIFGIVQNSTGLEIDKAKLFHLEMWACVHGIATMIATGYLDLDMELVSRIISDSYLGHKMLYGEAQ